MTLIFDGRPSDSPLVAHIWRAHSESAGEFISTAGIQWEMVVSRFEGRTYFSLHGPETRASLADYPDDTEFYGITFKLGTFMPHLPVTKILDRNDITLPEATNQSFWLLGSAWQIPTYDNADVFVNRLLREGLLAHDPVVDAVMQGQPPVMSVRTLQRRFVQATGLSPKTIQQIERAQQALKQIEQGTPILDVTHEFGYFDQSHLTNSLKRFVGQTPSQILALSQNP